MTERTLKSSTCSDGVTTPLTIWETVGGSDVNVYESVAAFATATSSIVTVGMEETDVSTPMVVFMFSFQELPTA